MSQKPSSRPESKEISPARSESSLSSLPSTPPTPVAQTLDFVASDESFSYFSKPFLPPAPVSTLNPKAALFSPSPRKDFFLVAPAPLRFRLTLASLPRVRSPPPLPHPLLGIYQKAWDLGGMKVVLAELERQYGSLVALRFGMTHPLLAQPDAQPQLLLSLAEICQRCNQVDEARALFARAHILQPHKSDAWLKQHPFEETSLSVTAAQGYLLDGIEACKLSSDSLAIKCIRWIERQTNACGRRAVLPLSRSKTGDGSLSRILLEAARFEARRGDLVAGLAVLTYLIRLFPTMGAAYAEKCRFYERLGDLMISARPTAAGFVTGYERAAAVVEQGLRAVPTYAPLYKCGLRVYHRLAQQHRLHHHQRTQATPPRAKASPAPPLPAKGGCITLSFSLSPSKPSGSLHLKASTPTPKAPTPSPSVATSTDSPVAVNPFLRSQQRLIAMAFQNLPKEYYFKLFLQMAEMCECSIPSDSPCLADPNLSIDRIHSASQTPTDEELQRTLQDSRLHYGRSCSYAPENVKWKVMLLGARTEILSGRMPVVCRLLSQVQREVAVTPDTTNRSRPLMFLETARLLQLAGRFDQAKMVLVIAKRAYPDQWKIFLHYCLLHLRTSRESVSMHHLMDALKQHPCNGRLWALFLSLLYAVPNKQALFLGYAIQLVPKSGEVWTEAAKMFLNPTSNLFNLREAQRCLEFAMVLTPQYFDTYVELCRLKLLIGGCLGMNIDGAGAGVGAVVPFAKEGLTGEESVSQFRRRVITSVRELVWVADDGSCYGSFFDLCAKCENGIEATALDRLEVAFNLVIRDLTRNQAIYSAALAGCVNDPVPLSEAACLYTEQQMLCFEHHYLHAPRNAHPYLANMTPLQRRIFLFASDGLL